MKRMFYPLLAGVILFTSLAMTMSTEEYKIKNDHSIKFTSKDPKGEFKEMKGVVKFDENDLAGSKFDLTFMISSISTGNGMMNKKSQTEEWFNVSKYPEIRYISNKIEKADNGYNVVGTLTMKGVSKEKRIPLKVTKSGNDLTFSGNFKVNRIDYKVGKKSDAVPDNIDVSYSIPVTKK